MDYPDDTSVEETPYSEEEEAKDNYFDEQREVWEEQTGSNLPGARKPESLFSLFKDVWRNTNSSKVSNLDGRELGDLGISVRDCQRISLLAKLLHHEEFAKYFMGTGEITLSTAMSKKGWLVNNLNPPKQKWRIFGGKQPPQQEAPPQ
jgi:hypothetical protein